jgi:hypothetical protein
MLGALGIVAACAVGAAVASYVMWLAQTDPVSGPIIAGVVIAYVAFCCAIAIGFVMTKQSWFVTDIVSCRLA